MMNKAKAEKAIQDLLEALGEDTTSPALRETPARVARMYEEVLAGRKEDADLHLSKVFPLDNPGLILEKDIFFQSLCEHHLLPFFGTVHIAYLPSKEVTGLSKLARTVETFARRLQLQERMTRQIADAIQNTLQPQGVMVMSEAEHLCMTMRGVRKPGAKTIALATHGVFDDPVMQQKILAMIRC